MFCSKCGAELPIGSSFCSNCGNPQDQSQQIDPNSYFYPADDTVSISDKKEGMGWYKFIIYFALFAGAVINFVQGILYCSGGIYGAQAGIDADYVYYIYPALKSLDVIYGIILFAMMVLAIYTRTRLKNFCKNGPTCLIAMNVITLAVVILYLAIGGAIVDANLMSANTLGSMVGSVTILLINIFYFKKRKHMFVN